jgi:hypothetical protein
MKSTLPTQRPGGGGADCDTGYELYAACETVRELDQLCVDLGMLDEAPDDVMHSICVLDFTLLPHVRKTGDIGIGIYAGSFLVSNI